MECSGYASGEHVGDDVYLVFALLYDISNSDEYRFDAKHIGLMLNSNNLGPTSPTVRFQNGYDFACVRISM